ncbi:MAG: FKBP-type peptidyl-prolyl cis-trans isomerase [Legionellales bacterium]|nr:FKBP-type peptidyl-prolyl cis-trans isomerase [Legionellales bacterium]
MRLSLLTTVAAASLLVGQAFAAAASDSAALADQKSKVSYAIGMSIGQNFKMQQIDVDPQLVARGITDAITPDAKPLMDKNAIESTMTQFQKDIMAKREQQFKDEANKNLEASNKFLSDNKSKEGVKEAANGLQYKVITEGNGPQPTTDDLVTVDYEGKLIDGKVFDSSYTRGKPVTFKVSQVIPGWTEALKMMKVGSTWEVFVPPTLAYGEHGIGGMIGPNQALIFKIHLIKINTQGDAKEAAAKADTKPAKASH